MRDLVTSEAYQQRWPVAFKKDREMKTGYETVDGGWRVSMGFGSSFIGLHPHGKIVDDPHNTKNKILTEAEIVRAQDVWTGLSQRGAAMDAWTILVMQRLMERDLAGIWLAQGVADLVHLCWPMRFEPPVWVDMGGGQKAFKPRMPVTPLGFQDPRTAPGELLWPELYPLAYVEDQVKNHLGPWGESGQYQQRPTPEGGLLFKLEDFKYLPAKPADVVRWVRFWDVAGTEGGSGPRTAGVLMGVTQDRRYVVADVVKGRWAAPGVDSVIHATAQRDGRRVYVREEIEGGSAGKAVISARTVRLAGFNYDGASISGKGDKVMRAEPFAVQVAAGNVYLVVADEAQRALMKEFVDECKVFPLGTLKDQVDAAGGAFEVLTNENVGELRLLGQAPDAATVAAVDDEIAALKRELGLQGGDDDEGGHAEERAAAQPADGAGGQQGDG
jgi:predicted phage terminase large subunit-like protein